MKKRGNYTYEEEQKAIQEMIANLSCYLHHNRTLESMRKHFTEITGEYVNKATFVIRVTEKTKEDAKAKIQELAPVIAHIMRYDNDIKGSEYRQPLQNRNKSLQKVCLNCNSDFEYRSNKRKFCSNKCKTAYHRRAASDA